MAAEQHEQKRDGTADYLPAVRIETRDYNQKEVNDAVIDELAKVPELYQRLGRLCRVLVPPAGEFQNAAYISDLSEATLQEDLSSIVDFQRYDGFKKEWVSSAPPSWCVKAVKDRGSYPGVPVLRGIVNHPVLRPDGTVLQAPGYDPSSYLRYNPSCEYIPVADRPTNREAESALTCLWDLVSQFPWLGPVDFSAWLSGVLTPFVRHAYVGGCPCFVVIANQARTGKSKLADIASIIATGEHAGIDTYEKDESELKKKIFGYAKNGSTFVLYDNVDCIFGNHILDAALTAIDWRDRQFHTQDTPKFPLKWILWVTSNNFRSKADTYKRIQPIRLKTKLELPENRTDLRDTDLEKTVERRRPELVHACLVLLRSFFVGHTDKDIRIPFWHTFPQWSEIIRKCLVYHGLSDPYLAHAQNTEDIDTSIASKRQLVTGWDELLRLKKVDACTAREAHRWLAEWLQEWQEHPDSGLVCETLINALQDPQVSPKSRGKLPEPGDIGYILRSVQDGNFQGLRLVAREKDRSGTRWAVERVEL